MPDRHRRAVDRLMDHLVGLNQLIDPSFTAGTTRKIDSMVEDLVGMNSLLAAPPEQGAESDEDGSGGKGGGRKGGGKGSFSFKSTFNDFVARRYSALDREPSIVGITHPSDGHPQQELTPDFCWFRPLAHNNQTWILYWPELTV